MNVLALSKAIAREYRYSLDPYGTAIEQFKPGSGLADNPITAASLPRLLL
jgi:hypothetical protein